MTYYLNGYIYIYILLQKEVEVCSQFSTTDNFTIKNDAISQVFGVEHRGWVLGYGRGVTPSKVDAQVQFKEKSKWLEDTNEWDEWPSHEIFSKSSNF